MSDAQLWNGCVWRMRFPVVTEWENVPQSSEDSEGTWCMRTSCLIQINYITKWIHCTSHLSPALSFISCVLNPSVHVDVLRLVRNQAWGGRGAWRRIHRHEEQTQCLAELSAMWETSWHHRDGDNHTAFKAYWTIRLSRKKKDCHQPHNTALWVL